MAAGDTLPYSSCFARASESHSVAVALLQAVVATESDWNPNARSHANAHGLMQIQWPGTAKHLGVRRLAQLYKPCTNIELGARYLRELLDRYEGDERRALAAYNYGPGRINKQGPIPNGAERYVATVRKHRARILRKYPARSVAPRIARSETGARTKAMTSSLSSRGGLTHQHVASFSSRARAERYARMLRKRVPRAKFLVKPTGVGHQVQLVGDPAQLTLDDKTVLSSLGWKS